MALPSCFCKFVANNAQLHDQETHITAARATGNSAGRRRLLLSSSAATLLAAATTDANDSRTALLQKYLKISEENKAKNDKERLDGYYKRNYRDYFGFVEGTLQAKDKDQLSESEKGILEWLEKNN